MKGLKQKIICITYSKDITGEKQLHLNCKFKTIKNYEDIDSIPDNTFQTMKTLVGQLNQLMVSIYWYFYL